MTRIRKALLPAVIAAAVSIGMGAVRAQEYAARARAAGWDVGQISATWKHELSRWAGLTFTTATAVFVVCLLSRIAHQRRSRALEAVLIVAAPFLLLCAGVAAYWPEHSLIDQGWYVNVGELASFWGIVCGAPIVVVSEVWFRWHGRGSAV